MELDLNARAGRAWLLCLLVATLTGCGSGGGGSPATPTVGTGSPSGGPTSSSSFTPGVFKPASTFADLCVSPRTGADPNTGQPWPDLPGTRTDENNWLRSWSNDTYLWYDEIQDTDPANFSTPDYFGLMKTFATTPSGAPKDKFHFTIPTDEWLALSQSGVSAGYGATFSVISARPPRNIVIAYTQPGTPAASPSVDLVRGDEVLEVDGVDAVIGDTPADVSALNAGLFPANPGESHTFTVKDPGSSTPRQVTVVSASVTEHPVQHVSTIDVNGEPVGYLLFNDHIATAEKELVDAINQLKSAGVVDLVLDMRYNGGGYLDIASELAYMIAGPVSLGQTFEEVQFNDKHADYDPYTGAPIRPTTFHSATLGFSATPGQPLPSLDLSRVFILTGPDTCSASESVINSLRGIDVDVYQIGSTTCGKPYGFYPTDNCGTTYFTIQFRGINAKGFGDYTDGFSPDDVASPTGVPLPGCQVADDFTHALGDASEARLAAALQYRADGTCPAVTGIANARASSTPGTAPLSAVDGHIPRSVWHENRIFVSR